MITFDCSECGSEIGVRDERDWIEHQDDGSHIYHAHDSGLAVTEEKNDD